MLKKLTRQPLKGKKRKRIEHVESDWKTYTSSSKVLCEDIESIGKTKFTFEILLTCENKFELAYHEARIQFEREVLLREDYYNGIINLRIPKAPKKLLKVSCNHKNK